MSNYIYLQEVEERYKTEKLYNAALKRGDSDVIRFYEKAVDLEAAISKSDARLEAYPVQIAEIRCHIRELVEQEQEKAMCLRAAQSVLDIFNNNCGTDYKVSYGSK